MFLSEVSLVNKKRRLFFKKEAELFVYNHFADNKSKTPL